MTMPTLPPGPPEPLLSAEEVAELLGIHRATFYRLAWWKARRIRVSPGRVAYHPADVRLYLALQTVEAA